MTIPATHPNTDHVDLDSILSSAQGKVRALVSAHPDSMPTFTESGRWVFDDDSWAPGWSGGFLTGMMWIFAEHTGDATWRDLAKKYCRILEPRKLDTGTHDLGFLFMPSWGRWHASEADTESTRVLIDAGKTLARRFNPSGGYLSTWVDEGSTFIDIMPNISLIFLASQLSGDASLARIATQHALTTRRFLVRGDASTAHEGWFDPDTGEFLRAATHQGFRADSSWVRGQAWAIYGFSDTYKWTGDKRFLDTARRCADLYIERVGNEFVGPNDWEDPHPEFDYEASAASIAAAAMIKLSRLDPHGARFLEYGRGIVARLSEPEFMSSPEDDWEGIIKHAIYHRANNLGVDQSIMWGDYYFVEAVHELSKL